MTFNIEKTIKLVELAIEKYVKSERKQKVIAFLEDKGELIFSAPASSKKEYHFSYPGGLVEHSLNVFRNLKKLNETFNCQFNEESMFLCALFHDIGKAMSPDMKEAHYVDSEEWQKRKGQDYTYNPNETYMTTHLRSVFLLQNVGIHLNEEEFLAIYLNDGQYLLENKPYALKEPKLAIFLHMADMISLLEEK